jgi:pyruvate-ferredoxin/flavodoxin oxidoreductase
MAHRKAFVLASSVAEPAHLGRGLGDALACGGAAFVHIHAPSPARHGFATDRAIEQARRAVHGRAHVLLRYDPGAEGVFGTRIDLEGNPGQDATWGDNNLASWAVEESRFADRFAAVKEGDTGGVPFADLLGQPAEQRAKEHAFVERGEVRLRVAPSVGSPPGELCASSPERRARSWTACARS